MNSIIPDAALAQHIAVLGKTGSGKTYAAKGAIVESLLAGGRRVGIVDPTSAWWGLRSSANGKDAGFPILVLGGDHGDLPLPALGGAAVARLLAEQNVNLVADTSQLTVGERTRWFIDFATTLHRANRAPLHLVMDEAHMFAPQGKVPDPDTGKMLHAANTLASGGRSRGIRLVMITQRPQKLHKDALTSADTLIAMRVLAPQDRLAVEDWIKGCGDIAQGKDVLNSLASLQRGEGWAWYPEGGFLRRLKFPAITTFDSSATPTDGHELRKPKGAAAIDLTEINKALADAVKEAEANDPKLLRAEISRLKAELAKQRPSDAQALHTAEQRAYERGRADGAEAVRAVGDSIKQLSAEVERQIDAAGRRGVNVWLTPYDTGQLARKIRSHTPATPVASGGLRRMLIALAQRPQGLTRRALGVRAGLSSQSGTFATYLGKARSEGWVNGDATTIRITEDGVRYLGTYDPLPTGRELLDYWKRQLGGGAARLLDVIAEAYPEAMTRQKAAECAGLSAESGTFATYLGKLRTLELVTRGELRLSDELA